MPLCASDWFTDPHEPSLSPAAAPLYTPPGFMAGNVKKTVLWHLISNPNFPQVENWEIKIHLKDLFISFQLK